MDGEEFGDHYSNLTGTDGQELINTIDEARSLANGDEERIWFVREGDGDEDEYEPDSVWDVEHWHGQFVNCLGFFVTAEPVKPEHLNTIFIY